MDLIQRIVARQAAEKKWTKKFQDFSSGDTVKVNVSIKEGEKERVQVFKGVVIKIQGSGFNKSFTVRKMSSGVGVERTFPFSSPKIESIEVVNRGKVRRSRLFYLRNLRGRAARLQSELFVAEGDAADSQAVEMEQKTTQAPVAGAKAEKKSTKKP